MNGQNRKDVAPGIEVDIVLKADQRSGKLTRGTVKDILTNSNFHPHGIKVRLTDGQVGRIKEFTQIKKACILHAFLITLK
ncbi:YwbE family protein [Bacillus megaterium]|nr:YwbE family protein [Priestia megaterium]